MTRSTLAILLLCVVAMGLRLWHLEFQSLWWDEGVSIYLSGENLRELTVAKDFAVDLHPPGYHLLLAFWTSIVGPSVFSDRVLSVYAGVLTVPLASQFARTLRRFAAERSSAGADWRKLDRSAATAVVAGILAAVSPIDIFYSQESRMYPLLPLIGAASLIATIGVLRSNRWQGWLAWTGINVVGMYVFYYLGLLSLAETMIILIVGLLARRDRVGPTLARWGIAQAALTACYLPWLVVVADHLGRTTLALPPETEVHLTSWAFVVENWRAFTEGFSPPPGSPIFLALWITVSVVGLVALGRRSPAALSIVLVCALLPVLGAGLVLLARPFYYPRFVLFVVIPLWALVAIAVSSWPRSQIVAIVMVTLIVVGNGWSWYHERTTPRSGYAPDDYRTVFQTIAERMKPGDLVVGGYPWQAGYVRAYLWQLSPHVIYLKSPIDAGQPNILTTAASRIWTLTYSPDRRFGPDRVESTLAQSHPTAFVDQFGDSRARLFASPTSPSTGPLVATFGQEIGLLAWDRPLPAVVRPSEGFSVAFRWAALGDVHRDYTVFVHLVGPDGKLSGQVDSPPIRGFFPTGGWMNQFEAVDRYNVVVDPHAPPGLYHVDAGFYDPVNGNRLEVGNTTSAAPDNQLDVGTVEVVAR